MTTRRKLFTFRPHAERFTAIVWDEANRIEHERRRPYPPFSDAYLLDWRLILKRKDVEHRDRPDRFQGLAAYRADLWEQARKKGLPAVCFVVFSKGNHQIRLITIRNATFEERNIFYT